LQQPGCAAAILKRGILMAALELFVVFLGLPGGLACVSIGAARAHPPPGRGSWNRTMGLAEGCARAW
jgi:hypothetical protein